MKGNQEYRIYGTGKLLSRWVYWKCANWKSMPFTAQIMSQLYRGKWCQVKLTK